MAKRAKSNVPYDWSPTLSRLTTTLRNTMDDEPWTYKTGQRHPAFLLFWTKRIKPNLGRKATFAVYQFWFQHAYDDLRRSALKTDRLIRRVKPLSFASR